MSADDLKKFTKLVEKAINGKKEEPTKSKVKVLKEGKSEEDKEKNLKIHVWGVTNGDFLDTLDEIKKSISSGNLSGYDRGDSYGYSFDIDREEAEEAEDDLDEASTATISKNNTARFKDEDWTNVVLHNTLVVKFNDDVIILNTGSFKTNVTKNRMNACSNEYHLGYNVVQMKGKWFVKYKGETIPYEGDKLELKR